MKQVTEVLKDFLQENDEGLHGVTTSAAIGKAIYASYHVFKPDKDYPSQNLMKMSLK